MLRSPQSSCQISTLDQGILKCSFAGCFRRRGQWLNLVEAAHRTAASDLSYRPG